MAIAKNKGLAKAGKKGNKKKQADPFLKKVWYNIKAPTYFNSKANKVGRTCVTKTQGTKIETEGLKGRVCEFNMADVQDGSEDGHKKIKLEVQEIQGKNCLTDFHGLSLTRDKMCQMIKKKHSLIEAVADCKTQDGYVVRIFVIAFTKDVKEHQVKVFTYAQSAQIKNIRKKMVQTVQQIVAQGQLKDLVKYLVIDKIEGDIKTATNRIYPLDPVHIQKVKIVKKPKLDIVKLMEIHDSNDAGDEGVAVDATEPEEAKNLLAA
ncbi:unnamed protein product [Amoebophrya sp. A120]|nr:unnamed protein product [Amoebophrya sp. A120]|eukprot:GSA120T00020924001.1